MFNNSSENGHPWLVPEITGNTFSFSSLTIMFTVGLSYIYIYIYQLSPVAQTVKHLSAVQETQIRSQSWEDPLEKEMATHSSTLAWKIPWMEEPGRPHGVAAELDTAE